MRKRSQKRNLDREIARAIFNAQVASDAGKGIFAFRHVPEPAVLGGYESKDVYVQKAIRLILASADSVFRFSVQGGGFTPYLVYFEARLGDGWKYQVSFHSYDEQLEPFLCSRKGRSARWDHRNSRDTAAHFMRYFGIPVSEMC